MSLPDVRMTIRDGGMGIVPTTAGRTTAKVGISSGGTAETVYSFSDPNELRATLKKGPLVEAADYLLTQAGGPVIVQPINPSQAGFAGAVTKNGTGTGTVAVSLAPSESILITITTAGALGTMAFTWKVGDGPVSQPVTSTASPDPNVFLVPGTHTRVSFAAGTYVLNSTYTIGTDTVVTVGGGGISTVTQASSPLDAYEVLVTIMTAGALGAAIFTYSVDGGDTTSGQITVPGGAGRYTIPDTGIVLTFANTFDAGTTYSFDTIGAGYNNTDVTNALTALRADSHTWFMVHLIGTAASAALAAATAAVLATQMDAAETQFRYAGALMEAPTVGTIIVSGSAAIRDSADTDSTLASAFSAFSHRRVSVGAGDTELVSSITGRIHRRNIAWSAIARAAQIDPGRDAAEPALGALGGVTRLFRDEAKTEALDAARFVTARSYVGRSGYYLTNFRMMAPEGSDFAYLVSRRVMDEACTVARDKLLNYLIKTMRVSPTTGFILEQDAQRVEGDVNNALEEKLVDTSPANASASSVYLSRTANILSTGTLPVKVSVVPLGYNRAIEAEIGFVNPALAA